MMNVRFIFEVALFGQDALADQISTRSTRLNSVMLSKLLFGHINDKDFNLVLSFHPRGTSKESTSPTETTAHHATKKDHCISATALYHHSALLRVLENRAENKKEK